MTLRPILAALAALALGGCGLHPRPHNVLIFVADGLRSRVVTPQTAPEMAALRAEGVDFADSHSVYPSLTTPNASALATGHRIGDTGDFGNELYVGAPMSAAQPSPFTFVEDDDALGGLDARFGGNVLGETSLMAQARQAGWSTAAIGKLGPVGLQDVTQRDGRGTLLIDDATGSPGGFPLPEPIKAAIRGLGLAPVADDRGLNGDPGTFERSGVRVANVQQQTWFVRVATEVILPRFKAADRPFMMVFWSRDPDGTQHNQGDSLNRLTPGINGPTSMAAIRNADDDLGRLRAALRRLGLERTTDVVVVSDHGFSTIDKTSATSPAAKLRYPDVLPGVLPPGFLAIDLAAALGLPLFDGYRTPLDWRAGQHSRTESSLLGPDPLRPEIAVAANGGSDLIYLPGGRARELAPRIVAALTRQDYVAAVFYDRRLGGTPPGALPLDAIGWVGSARTPRPAIVVSFRSRATGCAVAELCAAEVADTGLQVGQGMHGSLSRSDMHNFMAAVGPDFRRGWRDPAPVGNADVAPTLAQAVGLSTPSNGGLRGRVLSEALRGGPLASVSRRERRSRVAPDGFVTVLRTQEVGDTTYLDVASAPGRAVGGP